MHGSCPHQLHPETFTRFCQLWWVASPAECLSYWNLTIQLDWGWIEGVLRNGNQDAIILITNYSIEAHAHSHAGSICQEHMLHKQSIWFNTCWTIHRSYSDKSRYKTEIVAFKQMWSHFFSGALGPRSKFSWEMQHHIKCTLPNCA
jgi:hypothetical protein